jgi:CheY-like chemotaxis protein
MFLVMPAFPEVLAPAEPAAGATSRGVVLVVDDEPMIRTLVSEAIADEGYTVVRAADGREALAALARGAVPCLILLDMRMPEVDGWEFVRRYRRLPEPHAPIVVMTAARDAAAWAGEVGADGVLPKPFDITGIDEVLRRYCA